MKDSLPSHARRARRSARVDVGTARRIRSRLLGWFSSASYYRCSHAVKRGTCENRLSVREDLARERILGAITARLTSREGIAYARKRIVERLRDASAYANAELTERRQRLARTEKRISGLVSFIADYDRSEAVVSGLRDLETQARAEREAIAAIEREAGKPVELPNIEKILARVFDLEIRLRRDPAVAREQLRGLLKDGRITLDPANGNYTARGTLFPLGLLLEPKPQYAEAGRTSAYYGISSGGKL